MYIDTIIDDNYVTYSIPAKLNGESVDIKVLYSEEYPDGIVLGAWKGIDEKTGMPDKDIINICTRDEVIPQYYYYGVTDDAGGYVDGYVDGEAFKVGDELKLEVVELPEADYLYGFYMTDIAQNSNTSEFVEFNIKDGFITVKN